MVALSLKIAFVRCCFIAFFRGFIHGMSKTHRNHQNRKRDVIFQNPDPPEAAAPEIPYLESPAQSPFKSDLKSFKMGK